MKELLHAVHGQQLETFAWNYDTFCNIYFNRAFSQTLSNALEISRVATNDST